MLVFFIYLLQKPDPAPSEYSAPTPAPSEYSAPTPAPSEYSAPTPAPTPSTAPATGRFDFYPWQAQLLHHPSQPAGHLPPPGAMALMRRCSDGPKVVFCAEYPRATRTCSLVGFPRFFEFLNLAIKSQHLR
ncbi:hypothetical protein CEXT_381411 [Caerostris extrusa]|uniref:Uncharacterized protein n=1 Tax=Caerostris extrusa TaxID=172846 RepID=A0AAV4XUL2_CAEEX|nr:hypothetical protein CEXT_381411 [Caerostris extrusa]